MTSIPVIESEVDFHVKGAGKSCKTWYTIFGAFPSPSGIRPLVCLHGGPGVPHNCLRSIRHLSTTHGIPVIMYDQLGCGRSTHLPEKKGDGNFWTIDLFLSQLSNLLSHLGIQDDYDILGQSFGGILGNELAVRQPKGLKKLILANTPASKLLWREAEDKLRDQLPPDVLAIMKKHEADGTIDSEEYQKALGVYYERHLCRVKPLPKELMESLQGLKEDPTVHMTMNGPIFSHTGSNKDWSILDRIHKIKVPTLLINGKYDGAQDSVMEPFFEAIEKVKWVRFAESSHFPQIEEPEEYLKVVGGFLSMK